MRIHFSKYHGAGNDFIMIDERDLERKLETDEITFLCHRQFGVGADGIILISPHDEYDFNMDYINSDGSSGMMCANGSRCALAFARSIGYAFTECSFTCFGIVYKGRVNDMENIATGFPDLKPGRFMDMGYFIDVGAAHLVIFKDEFVGFDPREAGRRWRYHDIFAPTGVNVNFIKHTDTNHLEIITYERGVEDLTLACGTGALASAIAFAEREERFGACHLALESDGGTLDVSFHRTAETLSNIIVAGPAVEVFSAEIAVQKLSFS